MLLILVLFLLVGFAVYVMTPGERIRLLQAVLTPLRGTKERTFQRLARPDPFAEALRQRTRWPLVTYALAVVNVTVFVLAVASAGPVGEPESLIAWGANFGPRTTNGEWGRLMTSMFVHDGLLHLVVETAALVHLGLLLERLVGPLAFGAVYFAAGLVASVVGLFASAVTISLGASGAIFGLYGLLIAAAIWSRLNRSVLTLPLSALKGLAPSAAVFIVFSLAAESLQSTPEIAGLATGIVSGLLLARGVAEHKPPARRVAVAGAAMTVITLVSAVPLRGVVDVRPEVERVVAVEARTASTYEKAVEKFRNNVLSAEELVRLIEHTIVPELRAERDRLKAIAGVPREHQPLVAYAEEYLRLRDESWRLRAEGLLKRNLPTLNKADRTERASLDALEKIRPEGYQ
jgi:membrane associated rhomboid family serine protease